jgi:hypothetical protein
MIERFGINQFTRQRTACNDEGFSCGGLHVIALG